MLEVNAGQGEGSDFGLVLEAFENIKIGFFFVFR